MSLDRRRELGDFLRSRRARVSPEDVGLPRGSRRRIVGLRREEVALLAGVSTTWYTYLEQGRARHPSGQVLDAVARVLGLDGDETLFLHRLADEGASVSVDSGLSPEAIATALVRLDDASPYPTYAFDVYCDMVAWNPATTTYYTDFSALPPQRRNMMRWLITSDEARRRLPDWSNDVPDVVARWRKSTAVADRSRLDRQVAAFRQLSADFARWWDTHDVREHHTRIRRFDHPELGHVALRIIVVESPEFPGIRVVHHASLATPGTPPSDSGRGRAAADSEASRGD